MQSATAALKHWYHFTYKAWINFVDAEKKRLEVVTQRIDIRDMAQHSLVLSRSWTLRPHLLHAKV